MEGIIKEVNYRIEKMWCKVLRAYDYKGNYSRILEKYSFEIKPISNVTILNSYLINPDNYPVIYASLNPRKIFFYLDTINISSACRKYPCFRIKRRL